MSERNAFFAPRNYSTRERKWEWIEDQAQIYKLQTKAARIKTR